MGPYQEVDIWSFGCVLLELLTLQVPYLGFSDSHIYDLLQMSKRPQLTDELEALSSISEPAMAQSGAELVESEAELETLRFLVDLFCRFQDVRNRSSFALGSSVFGLCNFVGSILAWVLPLLLIAITLSDVCLSFLSHGRRLRKMLAEKSETSDSISTERMLIQISRTAL
ncbi:hypothetical protein CMV_028102 [Castanea mollissima]|uniref:Protein kinase domain-containing protein n=1 Tax=Castanea mollissima TaxID=60419 RepID=A0A8J4Q8X3_9ROSI|nr:hypothetical protein CMV_028102 [Castanea mollissima]